MGDTKNPTPKPKPQEKEAEINPAMCTCYPTYRNPHCFVHGSGAV